MSGFFRSCARLTVAALSVFTVLTALGHGATKGFGLPNLFMLAVALPMLALAVFYPRARAAFARAMRSSAGKRALAVSALCCLLAVFILFGVFSAFMLGFAEFMPPAEDVSAVIVLGCKIDGDRPSLMLKRRLDAALGYLSDHPDAVAVLSGGYGEGLPLSEASVMRAYLVSRGTPPDRLILEERSSSTEENLRFSAELLAQRGISGPFAIATDGFHQLRAHIWAERWGLGRTGSLSSATPLYLFAYYYFREFMGLTRYVLIGR